MPLYRDKALATISADGILLVLASMIDNMPYVLAEASVMRIPLLIYDVGGVTEMIDPKLHADIICGTPKVITLSLSEVWEVCICCALQSVEVLYHHRMRNCFYGSHNCESPVRWRGDRQEETCELFAK